MSEDSERLNVAEELLRASTATPSAIALRLRSDDETADVSYGELARCVRRFAEALCAAGIAPEQRVLILLPDRPELVIAFLGAIWAGAVPVLVNPFLRSAEYEFFLRDCGARALVTTAALASELDGALRATDPGCAVFTVEPHRRGPFWEATLAARERARAAATHREDPAFWLYSSGTTGKPKGAVHLHANVLACLRGYGSEVLAITAADVCYATSKLFFAYGLGASLYFPLAVGAAVVLSPEAFRPDRAWALLERERPTLFFSVPSCYRALLEIDARGALPFVRLCLSAGEGLPPGVFEQWRARTGHEILDGIGSTEMLHIYLSNLPGRASAGTLGEVIRGYEVKIVDEEGRPLPDGEPGTMHVRGGSAAAGYWRRREATWRAFLGDWYVTGDRAVRDADGRYRILGRADDLLKISGQWVGPGDVEEVIAQVGGVRECAVVGRSGADGLLELGAFVVPVDAGAPPAVQAIHDGCAAALPRFKRPREVRFVEAFPRTATGKLQRFRLRELAESSATAGSDGP